ncbi:MAG: HAD hydrolase-like protein [Verrucomicrobiae bacterium]|nr:HAD hydrolase-like protein [Verrucomicrobiae bacterium]
MIRLALFDIDGTLIRTGGAGIRAFDRALALEFGVENATRQINFAGSTDRGILREFFANHSIEPNEDSRHRFFRSYVHWLDYFLSRDAGDVLPGVTRLLRDLLGMNNRPAIGLLTGNIRLGAQIKLRHHRLWNFFETGAFGCEHHDRNEVARIALERGRRLVSSNLRGDEILVVGDTLRDIDCANAIGARCLAVATGEISLEELQSRAPAWAVTDLTRVSAGEICR